MINDLFDLYRNNASVEALCTSRFMCQLVRHNQDNDRNLDYIREIIVPAQVRTLNKPELISEEPVALNWLSDFNATIADPSLLSAQVNILQGVPSEMKEILTKERVRIGVSLINTIKQGWIDKEKLKKIIEEMQLPGNEMEKPVELTEETSVEYFIQCYRFLISSGGNFHIAFRDSLVAGLKNLKKHPILNSYLE